MAQVSFHNRGMGDEDMPQLWLCEKGGCERLYTSTYYTYLKKNPETLISSAVMLF